jgi:hypothetical protein
VPITGKIDRYIVIGKKLFLCTGIQALVDEYLQRRREQELELPLCKYSIINLVN